MDWGWGNWLAGFWHSKACCVFRNVRGREKGVNIKGIWKMSIMFWVILDERVCLAFCVPVMSHKAFYIKRNSYFETLLPSSNLPPVDRSPIAPFLTCKVRYAVTLKPLKSRQYMLNSSFKGECSGTSGPNSDGKANLLCKQWPSSNPHDQSQFPNSGPHHSDLYSAASNILIIHSQHLPYWQDRRLMYDWKRPWSSMS